MSKKMKKEKHDDDDDDEYIIFVSLIPESFISCLAFQDAIYIHIKLSISFLIRVLRLIFNFFFYNEKLQLSSTMTHHPR